MVKMVKQVVRATRSDGMRSRQAILSAAANLATLEGLEGLSIGKLAEHIGMSKSGLYAHFESKQDLQLATIESALDILEQEVIGPAVAHGDPLDRLEGLYTLFLDYLRRRVFPGGCFFAVVSSEFGGRPGPVKDRLRQIHLAWLDLLTSQIAELRTEGRIHEDIDPAQMAFELDSYLLLAHLHLSLHDDESALGRAQVALKQRLAEAIA
jgi:AcrR family transcriptional regulator